MGQPATDGRAMNALDFRDSLAQLGLSQAEAARLLGVELRTVQRWAAGRPVVGEPAAQALRAWCRLAERGIAWRPDGDPVETEDLIALAGRRRAALGLPRIPRQDGGKRGGGHFAYWSVAVQSRTGAGAEKGSTGRPRERQPDIAARGIRLAGKQLL